MTTTSSKVSDKSSVAFADALLSSCLRRGVLSCSIAEIRQDNPSVILPFRSDNDVLLAQDLTFTNKTSDDKADEATANSSSSFSKYVLSPIKTTASVVGTVALFVVNTPDIVARAFLPASDYYDHDAGKEKKREDDAKQEAKLLQDDDVVVANSLLVETAQTLKRALDLISPAIISASDLRDCLVPKLQEKEWMDASRIAWLKRLKGEHLEWLMCQVGLDVVPPTEQAAVTDYSRSSSSTALYIFGKTELPKDVRITLYRMDSSIQALDRRIEEQEAKMLEAREKTTRATTKRLKVSAFKVYKIHEKIVEDIEASRLNLLQVRESVEGAATQRETVGALKAASEALKTLRLDVDETFDIMDELQMNTDEAALDTKLLHQNSPIFDDDELLKELELLAVDSNEPTQPPSQGPGQLMNALPDISEADLKELDNLMEDEKPAAAQEAQ